MITLIRESKFNVGQTVSYMSPFGEPRQAKVRGIKYVQTEGIEQSNNKGTFIYTVDSPVGCGEAMVPERMIYSTFEAMKLEELEKMMSNFKLK